MKAIIISQNVCIAESPFRHQHGHMISADRYVVLVDGEYLEVIVPAGAILGRAEPLKVAKVDLVETELSKKIAELIGVPV